MLKTKIFIGLLLVVLAVSFAFLPGLMDKRMNRVEDRIPTAISPRVEALHERLFVADLHADPLLWKRDLTQWLDHGQVDVPRLQAGNVALQVFGSPTKTPRGQNYDANAGDTDNITALAIAQLQPIATWTSLYQRALFHAEKLERLEKAAEGHLRIIRTVADLEALARAREAKSKPVGALLGLEGAHALEGRIENLDGLFEAGFRMVGLAHFFDNEAAGSMHGMEKYGLTDFGRELVARAEALGIVVDIAHSSPAAIDDVLAIASRPVVVSHTGVKATCDVNRNLSDEQIIRIAANGGLIGIGYWDAAVCDTTPRGIVAAMSHVRDLVGVEHVALGSDFDGAVVTRFDTSELALLTQELLVQGFTKAEIRAVMGGNALSLFRKGLPPGESQ
jgi:microsomal dipeptidase-like Zn-dependent dipeptidase